MKHDEPINRTTVSPLPAEVRAQEALHLLTDVIDELRNLEIELLQPPSKRTTNNPDIECRIQELVERVETNSLEKTAELEYSSRSIKTISIRLLFHLVLPLLETVRHSYDSIDAEILPIPPPPNSSDKESSKPAKPPPPPGLLSLRNYTDIAIAVELAICLGIVPWIEPNILCSVKERLSLLPRSLAGRFPKRVVSALVESPFKADQSFSVVASTYGNLVNLVRLDRFQPMLLPRHVVDFYAASLQCQQWKGMLSGDEDSTGDLQVFASASVISLCIPPILQARAYPTLLRAGTAAPRWLRQVVSKRLSYLSRTNLLTVLHVWIPPNDENSAAARRLARGIVSREKEEESPDWTRLLCQMRIVLNSLASSSETAPLKAKALWAILQELPEAVRDEWVEQELLQPILQPGESLTASLSPLALMLGHVPPLGVMGGKVIALLFKPVSSLQGSSYFGLLARWACVPTIVQSSLKETVLVALSGVGQLLENSLVGSGVSWMDVWSLSLILLGIAPNQLDAKGHYFQYSADNEKFESTTRDTSLELLVEDIEHRMKAIVQALLKNDHVFCSRMFRFLLRLFLAATESLPDILSEYRFIAMICLPVLCEECDISTLLGSSAENNNGLFPLMQIAFSSLAMQCAPGTSPAFNVEGFCDDDLERSTAYLASLCSLSAPMSLFPSSSPVVSGAKETLTVVGTILVSMLVTILEVGSTRRSAEDEKQLQSLRQLLTPLSEIPSSDSAIQQSAELAEMSSHAVALLAARTVADKHAGEPHTTDQLLHLAERDLGSPEPAIRARGVVHLRHLTLADHVPKESREQLLYLTVCALQDIESYVYLAAIHTLVAITEENTCAVFPLLGRALVLGTMDTPEVALSAEQRIKVAEALVFAIRRKPAILEIYSYLVEMMIFGPMDSLPEKLPDEQALQIQQLSHEFILKGYQAEDEAVPLEKDWDSIQLRVQTGGLLFTTEENEVVRASRITVTAELVSGASPFIVAKFVTALVTTSVAILRYETSRPVRRAGSQLAKEIYGAVQRELEGLTEPLARCCGADIPLSTGLANHDGSLVVALERCRKSEDLNDLKHQRYYDPAVEARCEEALAIRIQVREALAAGVVAHEAQAVLNSDVVARLLRKGEKGDPIRPRPIVEELA